MFLYLLNYGLIILYMLFFLNAKKDKKEKVKKILFVVSVIQIVCLLGLRGLDIGSDLPFYWKYYDLQQNYEITNLSFSRYELFFKLLTKGITLITLNKQFYLFAISVLSIVPIAMIVYKYSKNPFLSLLLFMSFGFYNFDFSGLRQAIAFALTFYSFRYIKQQKLLKYILIILCATLFHKSALIFFPAYFLKNIKITKAKIYFLVLVDVFIYLFKVQIFNFVNRFFYDEYSLSVSDSYTWMIMCLFVLCFCFLFYKKVVKENNSVLFNLVIIGTTIMLLSPIASNILRVANYYFMFIILLVPEVIAHIRTGKNRFYVGTIVVIFSILLYVYLLSVDSYHIVPYAFGGIL